MSIFKIQKNQDYKMQTHLLYNDKSNNSDIFVDIVDFFDATTFFFKNSLFFFIKLQDQVSSDAF